MRLCQSGPGEPVTRSHEFEPATDSESVSDAVAREKKNAPVQFFPELNEPARPAAARPVSRVGGRRASAVRTGRRDIDRRKPEIGVHDRSCRG